MSVAFVDVPEFLATGSNTFEVTMHSSCQVEIEYGGLTALDGLVGLTEGGGAPNPGETDLSAAGSLPVTGTTYEQFSFGDAFDLTYLYLLFIP